MKDEELALQLTLSAHSHFDSNGNDRPTPQAIAEQIDALLRTYVSTLAKVEKDPRINPPRVARVLD